MEVVPVVGLELAKSVFRVHASRRAMGGCLSADVDARSELPPLLRRHQDQKKPFRQPTSHKCRIIISTKWDLFRCALRLVDKRRPNLSSFSAPIAGEGGPGVGPYPTYCSVFTSKFRPLDTPRVIRTARPGQYSVAISIYDGSGDSPAVLNKLYR